MPNNDEGNNGDGEQRVPLARLNQVLQEKKEAETRAAEMAARIAELEKAQKPDDQLRTQVDELTAKLTTLQTDLATEQAQNLRQRAAAAAKLNVDKYAGRLHGATYDELLADALSIAEDLKPVSPGQLPPPSGDPPPSVTDAQMNDPKWVRENMEKVWGTH